MKKPKEMAPEAEEALAALKQAVAAGNVVIGNEAAKQGGAAVVVKAGARRRGVIILQWSRPGIGFGELTLVAEDGKLRADREAMSEAFCLDVLRQALREGAGA